MKHFLLSIALLAGHAVAQENWVTLFDGKTLTGWEQHSGTAEYRVEDGAVVGKTVAGTGNSFLCTSKKYSDFILEVEFKVDPSMNSGIQFRSNVRKSNDGKEVVYGPQCEVDPSARAWSGGVYDEQRRQWLYTLNFNPEGQKAFKGNGAWNKYRIEAIDGQIRTWINDIPTANLVDTLIEKGFSEADLGVLAIGDSCK
jgi:hypothetical protein